ncbi:hypothetical protein [Microbacterium maritypicum]|uniref:Transmembrane protein n=1 Tax=Microbacterium maritypicum MF109 TaxID=1333857 RepID=T5KH05_MICMQ|nr:hypothetical protein [Microbacterium liquefaciens]EQM74749.1 hypothetical protein L687_04615 [Microbacterium maritypicum MF109]
MSTAEDSNSDKARRRERACRDLVTATRWLVAAGAALVVSVAAIPVLALLFPTAPLIIPLPPTIALTLLAFAWNQFSLRRRNLEWAEDDVRFYGNGAA